MNCQNCGSQLDEGATFCGNCGAAVEEKTEQVATPTEQAADVQQSVTEEEVIAVQGEIVQDTAQGMQSVVTEDKKGVAIAGLVLGILSPLVWLIPLFGYPVTIVGIIMSAKGMKTSGRGMAIAGMILSIIGLVLTLGNSVLGACIYCLAFSM